MENPEVLQVQRWCGGWRILRLWEPRGEDDCRIDEALRGDRDPAGI